MPEVVIGPPVKPVPVLMLVTVPPVEEMVISPVAELTEMPAPAVNEVTPVLDIVTFPDGDETDIPVPAITEDTIPDPPTAVMIPDA